MVDFVMIYDDCFILPYVTIPLVSVLLSLVSVRV